MKDLNQCRQALGVANAVRTERAQIKRDVAVGRRDVAELLEDPPASCLKMPVRDLLVAVPRIGQRRAERIALRAGTSELRQIGKLTMRQRREIAALASS